MTGYRQRRGRSRWIVLVGSMLISWLVLAMTGLGAEATSAPQASVVDVLTLQPAAPIVSRDAAPAITNDDAVETPLPYAPVIRKPVAIAPVVDAGAAPAQPSALPLAMPSGLEALTPTPPTATPVAPSRTLPASTPRSGRLQDTWNVFLEDKPAPGESKSDSSEAAKAPNADKASENASKESKGAAAPENAKAAAGGGATNAAASQADAQLVANGRAAFERSCTDCHDAERATQKRKSRSAWLGTIRRMASMDGADVASSDFNAIAAYLASLHSPVGAASNSAQASAGGEAQAGSDSATSTAAIDEGPLSSLSLGGTVSTLWRGGNDNLESPDFFPDVWLTAAWQPSGPLSGRVTTCTSCHSDRSGGTGFTFELVEASASFDLLHSHKERRREANCDPKCEWGAEIKAGRLVVPFGAFASMSHPGVYRTITNPLVYNMGRRVNAEQNRPPVLPMPYSDEGADLSLRVPLLGSVYATADLYAVNGLQGFGPGVQFSSSRSYTDNNSEPAIGGRATVGTSDLRVGGSVMSGRMQEEGATPLGYKLTGADATWRYRDLLRTYFEYAIRANDNDISDLQQMTYGIVAEGEVLLWSEPDVHFLLRYDTLEYRDRLGEDSTDRITWGFNTTLPGGSLLILNHERWRFHTETPDVDVVGLRWVVTF